MEIEGEVIRQGLGWRTLILSPITFYTRLKVLCKDEIDAGHKVLSSTRGKYFHILSPSRKKKGKSFDYGRRNFPPPPKADD